MDVAQVIDLGRESLWVAVMVATPLLGVALGVGLIIGIFQAATSIQEMTLSFIPKLGVMVLALIAFGSWQIAVMVDFFQRIFERIPTSEIVSGSTVRVQMFGISKGYYDFLDGLGKQVFRGGLFDGPPANISSNFDNGALGYFVAASERIAFTTKE